MDALGVSVRFAVYLDFMTAFGLAAYGLWSLQRRARTVLPLRPIIIVAGARGDFSSRPDQSNAFYRSRRRTRARCLLFVLADMAPSKLGRKVAALEVIRRTLCPIILGIAAATIAPVVRSSTI